MLDTIPANVTGSIVPKTLFGEKYVSLEVPETGPSGTMRAGAVIDRTEVSIEVEKVLSDLYPLLRAVSPADINYTLNALATALEGRGESVGREPRDPRRLPQAGQPPDPRHRRGPAAHRPRLRPVRRRAARRRADPARHDQDHRDARGSRGQAARAVPRRRVVLRHRPHLPRRERGQPDPARRPQRRPAAAVRQVRAGVPLPARRHRQRRQGPGRGVPRLHPAHRARAAAQPAARLHRGRRAALRRGPRAELR